MYVISILFISRELRTRLPALPVLRRRRHLVVVHSHACVVGSRPFARQATKKEATVGPSSAVAVRVLFIRDVDGFYLTSLHILICLKPSRTASATKLPDNSFLKLCANVEEADSHGRGWTAWCVGWTRPCCEVFADNHYHSTVFHSSSYRRRIPLSDDLPQNTQICI